MDDIKQAIAGAAQELFNVEIEPELTRPDEQFGDYATNVALQLAGKLDNPPAGGPREIAEAIARHVQGQSSHIKTVEVAGPGFLNISLTDDALIEAAHRQIDKSLSGKTVVAEYSDPNPFKVLHAGHLYTSIVGDAVANLLEVAGAKVYRVNFGGDVGLHVAKTMWAILQNLDGEYPENLKDILEESRPDWLTDAYIQGNNIYENNESIRPEIVEINKRIYKLHEENDHDSPFAQIYWQCREWSYAYFKVFYNLIGTHFDKYYPESETAPLGLKTVQEQLAKGVFEASDGAVVFDGEKYGLHTRVFINSEGLPTYEAKDVGLIFKKYEDYHFDVSVVITGNDIVEYMKVVLKAVEQFAPGLTRATRHMTHGIVKLEGGTKMSSRKGNILRATDVLFAAAEANKHAKGNDDEQVVLSAVKYAFLKNRVGGDIIYDPVESVSLEGNSGPYLQYAHARARSILSKKPLHDVKPDGFEAGERSLLRKITEYPEVVEKAVSELMPHYICTYLYELAQNFNRFYEHNRVIDDPREAVRLQLVQAYADTLKHGLELLNITAPEKM